MAAPIVAPNPYSQSIGAIVTGRDVELAALTFLKRWAGTYLAECERQRAMTPGALPRIRSWTTAPDFETWPEDQLPCVLLVSPGLADAPLPDGAGVYRAKFTLGVAVIVSTARMDETARLAKLYVAAMRAAILQHQSLEGFASGIEWLDENYDDLPSIDDRSLGAGQAIFAVQVDGFARRWNGPKTPQDPPDPDTDPLPTDPYVQPGRVGIEVTRLPI
jgi:hypothetical protein